MAMGQRQHNFEMAIRQWKNPLRYDSWTFGKKHSQMTSGQQKYHYEMGIRQWEHPLRDTGQRKKHFVMATGQQEHLLRNVMGQWEHLLRNDSWTVGMSLRGGNGTAQTPTLKW